MTKQYGTQKSVAELNIHVQRGRIYGLLGRNGILIVDDEKDLRTMIRSIFESAGYTQITAVASGLLGLTQPTSGKVTIWGKSLSGNEKKLLPRIGSLVYNATLEKSLREP